MTEQRVEAQEWFSTNKNNYIYPLKPKKSRKLVGELYDAKAVRVEVGIDEEQSGATATIYITIDPKNITKNLLELFANLHPDEFSEEKENIYRVWWD